MNRPRQLFVVKGESSLEWWEGMPFYDDEQPPELVFQEALDEARSDETVSLVLVRDNGTESVVRSGLGNLPPLDD